MVITGTATWEWYTQIGFAALPSRRGRLGRWGPQDEGVTLDVANAAKPEVKLDWEKSDSTLSPPGKPHGEVVG